MDIRMAMTLQLIHNSFLELLKEKDAEKITVVEICKKAQINRSTFYKYYTDPVNLLDMLEKQHLDELQKKVEDKPKDKLFDVFSIILNEFYEKKDEYTTLYLRSGGLNFKKCIFKLFYDDNRSVIDSYFPSLQAQKKEWLYRFIAEGCVSVLTFWIEHGMDAPVSEVASFLVNTIDAINHHADLH